MTSATAIQLFDDITFTRRYRIVNYADNLPEPIDLSGKTIVFEFYKCFGQTFSISSEDAPEDNNGCYVNIVDEEDGLIELKITDEQTTLLLSQGTYRAEIHDPNGDKTLIIRGNVIFTKN